MLRLGPRQGIDDDTGYFLEIALARLQIADDDLQLREAIEQRRQPALLLGGQAAEAFDQVLHNIAFAIAPQRQPVARPHGARMQIMATLQFADRLIKIEIGLSQIVLFRLHVQHGLLSSSRDSPTNELWRMERRDACCRPI